ncbi:MAG: autotransporter outer membrane beta-barrel domain-containing protein [Saprospiraceae bacterium]
MRTITQFSLWGLFVLGMWGNAKTQTDTLPPGGAEKIKPGDRLEEIEAGRIELRVAFLRQDSAAVGFWLDSLGRAGNDAFAATLWDERWLLYHWLGRYPQLLEEVAGYTQRKMPEGWLARPPQDSLFELIDDLLYAQRFELFEHIRRCDLSTEDRLFALLHLEFLLRTEAGETGRQEQDLKLENFIAQYPESRFRDYIRAYMYDGKKPGMYALGIDFAFSYGNWTDQLARNLTPQFGFQFGFAYWKKHWTVQGRSVFGRQRLARPISVGSFTWPDNDPARSFNLSLEIGRDLVDQDRLRMFPSAGIGVCFLNPPSVEDGADPYPAYYDSFYFTALSLTAALTTDLKFPFKDAQGVPATTTAGYHGVRLRFGYSKLNFGRKNNALGGNLIFFAVGYNLFGPQSSKRSL